MRKKKNIPDSLRMQMTGYRKSLLYNKALLTVSSVVSVLILSFLLFFVSDRLWETPFLFRIVFLFSGFIFAIWEIIHFSGVTLRNLFDIKYLATNIQKNHKILGDHLLGAIELAQSEQTDENVSAELKEAAIEKITRQAAQIDFRSDINRKKSTVSVSISIILLACSFSLFVFVQPAAMNSLSRWLNPFSGLKRFTFTKFDDLPEEIFVLEGEKNKLSVRIADNSIWHPKYLNFHFSRHSSGRVEFNNGRAIVEITGPSEKANIIFSAYDAQETCSLMPVSRSALSEVSIFVEYPSYLQKKNKKIVVSDGIVNLLKGTSFYLEGSITRELKELDIEVGKTKLAATFKDFSFISEKTIACEQGVIRVNWLDSYGFSPVGPAELLLKITHDSPPDSECENLLRFIPLLRTETLELKLHSSDDFGIKQAGVKITGEKNKKQLGDKSLELEKVTAEGSPDTRIIDSKFIFSPELLNIPEKQTVTIHSWALDYKPNRLKALSPPYKIYILSEEQHVKFIQNKLDKLMSDMEDAIRREENSLEKNKQISRMDDKKLSKAKTTEGIRKQNLAEKAEKREMTLAASNAQKLMNEAMKNKKFPSSTIAQWSKLSQKMKKISKGEMSETVRKLNNAMKSQDKSKRREEMIKAVKEQKETLKKMKKMLSSMNDSMEKLMLESFVNRLRKKSTEERRLSDGLKSILPDVLGSRFKELDKPHQEVLEELNKEHNQIAMDAGYIFEDLEAFFGRTSMKKYKKVFDSMEELKMNTNLNNISSYIASNFTSRSIRGSLKMSGNFLKWSEMLKKSNNDKDKSNSKSEEQKVNMELLVKMMKLIYDEQLLRRKTRHLDKNKPVSTDEYANLANLLSADQGDVHLRMSFIQNKLKPESPAGKMLDRAGNIMNEVVSKLQSPTTDSKVIAAQTEIIEMLSGACENTASKSSAATKSAAMAMMMQLMPSGSGAGSGMSPGSSSMGGDSMRRNMNFSEATFQKQNNHRNIDKTDGESGLNDVPLEYKNAVESYYKKLNSIK